MRIYDYLKLNNNFSPKVGLVLGSGLGDFVSCMDGSFELKYSEIEGFPCSTVSGHAGKFVFGTLGGIPIAAMQGRVHYYEGYSMQQVVKPIFAMADMGITTLILTNAAGGIDKSLMCGDFMLLTDHIMNVPNPLIGKNNEKYGARFPDMSNVYDGNLQNIARTVAIDCGIALKDGVYVQLTGPSYETPAEIKMWGMLGASAVGMSTACEAVVAAYCGIRVMGISCITNLAAGLGGKLSHEEVKRAGDLAKVDFAKLIKGVLARI